MATYAHPVTPPIPNRKRCKTRHSEGMPARCKLARDHEGDCRFGWFSTGGHLVNLDLPLPKLVDRRSADAELDLNTSLRVKCVQGRQLHLWRRVGSWTSLYWLCAYCDVPCERAYQDEGTFDLSTATLCDEIEMPTYEEASRER